MKKSYPYLNKDGSKDKRYYPNHVRKKKKKDKNRFRWFKTKCWRCGLCIASCPNFPDRPLQFGSNKEVDDTIIHDPSKCSWCGICEKACSQKAIKIKREK